MNFEIFRLVVSMLNDPTVPAHRVFRKAFLLSIIGSLWIVYFRHVQKDLSLGEPLIITLGLVLLAWVVFGIFGGAIAASLYESLLKAVDANRKEPSLATFYAEWLYAMSAPLLGLLAMGILGGIDSGIF